MATQPNTCGLNPAMWDAASADVLLRRIADAVAGAGLEVELIGSVARAGRSDHDLDLLVRPLPQRRDDFDYEVLLSRLQELGQVQNTSTDVDEIDQLTMCDGRIVDVFFCGEAAG